MIAIVAVDKNWGIGKDGKQQLFISPDLKRFKEFTTGNTITNTVTKAAIATTMSIITGTVTAMSSMTITIMTITMGMTVGKPPKFSLAPDCFWQVWC